MNEQKKGQNEKCTGCGIDLVPSAHIFVNTKGDKYCTRDCQTLKAIRTGEPVLKGQSELCVVA